MTDVGQHADGESVQNEVNLFDGKTSIPKALEALRLRLLDLTGRNRLVNFKHSPGKALQFIHSDMGAVFQRLTSDGQTRVTIVALPEPSRQDWVSDGGRSSRPDTKEHAQKLGIDPSYDLAPRAAGPANQIRTLFYAEDLARHCRKLEREAKLAIEETGANMLFLVFGFLEYPEHPSSEKLYRAPLLCIPVVMTKVETATYPTFHLTVTGEELTDNLSLREKVKRDFGLSIPEYDIEEEASAEEYFDAVSESVAHLPEWRVRRMMSLTLLSFTNMLLVRDLDPDNWPTEGRASALLTHPVVRQVIEGRPATEEANYAEEYAIDDHPLSDLPLVYDADSSQHSALIDVLAGKDRVIEGPPGTGKSQTITNLIAAAMQAGKKVLFVAEKLAALQVVHARLAAAGLDYFVLELHSNKSHKKKVLEEIEKRLALRTRRNDDLTSNLEQLDAKRSELKKYSDLLNSQEGNAQGLSLHQVIWRAELNRTRCLGESESVQHLALALAASTSKSTFAALCDSLTYLAESYEAVEAFDTTHPLWGFFPRELTAEDTLPIQRTLEVYSARFQQFAKAMDDAAAMLGGGELMMGAESADKLCSALSDLAPAEADEVHFHLLPRLFSSSDQKGAGGLQLLEELRARQEKLAELEREVSAYLVEAPRPVENGAEEARRVLEALNLASLDNVNLGDIERYIASLSESTDKANSAIARLALCAGSLGLPFNATQEEIAHLKAVQELATKAPVDQFHLRHPELSRATAAPLLRSAANELKEISVEHSQLAQSYYLDLLPTDGELKEAINTLREGDAWYRVLQAPWRNATGIYKRLCRVKRRTGSPNRLAALEVLLEHRQRERNWHESKSLQRLAGTHFNGAETPLAELALVADWLAGAASLLELAGVGADIFDPQTIERARLQQVIAGLRGLDVAIEELDALGRAAAAIVSEENHPLKLAIARGSWKATTAEAISLTSTLSLAHSLLKQTAKDGVTSGSGLRGVIAAHTVPRLTVELEEYPAGRMLFGQSYRGRNTMLGGAFAAHAFGVAVKAARLPGAVERILMSGGGMPNHQALASLVSLIGIGWKDLFEFAEKMGRFGDLQMSQWANTDGPCSHSMYAKRVATKTKSALGNVDKLLPWAQYVTARELSAELELKDFVLALEQRQVAPKRIRFAFCYRFYASIAHQAFERHKALRQFSSRRHMAVREEFAAIDRETIKLRGSQIAADCRADAKPPGGNYGARVDDKTEMELLKHLLPQQRPRVPIRKLLRRSGRAIQELKPCFMMGPQAVAQFLEPGRLKFDIVVMDEASQLKPEQAIGAIARGGQLVVVGDPKQLPPTTFFSKMGQQDGDEEQTATADAESILDVCISHFQPIRSLRWHYRSQHESLIAFSNHHFYRGKLIVFPSPYPKGRRLGVRYHFVENGVYENQMNHAEARRIVDAAVDHILTRPADSLGIATLNIKQRDLIAELLDARLHGVNEARAFVERWNAEGMGLFVKNLENVQGDERDCIIIGTTFGKAKGADATRQNFGPISREGGWRRLNVLFTRARKSLAIYSSMRAGEIRVDRSTPLGTKALRDYLEYAQTGNLPIEQETGLEPESDFEIAVIDALSARGYACTPQLGVAGFRIDIGVKHPDLLSGYLAAIECDGATYHSGVSVRDRDRIRQEVLESLGWRGRIFRIWSADWFRNPGAEAQRMFSFLEKLREQPLPEGYEKEQTPPAEAMEQEIAHGEQSPEELVIGDAESDLEIAVGDLVTYANTEDPSQELKVRITSRQTDPNLGLIAETTPLASIMLGATAGETVVLRVPGKLAQSFTIISVKRTQED